MLILDHYIFNTNTAMLGQMTNEYGEYFTVIVENKRIYRVNMPMQKLIEINLNYYGSSFRGARDGSRAILGNIHMYPIAINIAKNIIWFPSESMKNPSLRWFALDCILTFGRSGDNETEVTLTSGLKFVIPVKHKEFLKRYNHAHLLKSKMEQRTTHMSQFIAERFIEYKVKDDEIDLNE
ncbi:competence protein ComK [Solibacillus sp. CAU 1738]|uniref:competence protein ComK n=1 Tax=Solibacillus sp. CAU 1738 TaxID=3140363 RepID=UPI0032609111